MKKDVQIERREICRFAFTGAQALAYSKVSIAVFKCCKLSILLSSKTKRLITNDCRADFAETTDPTLLEWSNNINLALLLWYVYFVLQTLAGTTARLTNVHFLLQSSYSAK